MSSADSPGDHEPTEVLVAGDWHAAIPWCRSVVGQLVDLLPNEAPRIVLHAGDFGVWRGGEGAAYLDALDRSLRHSNSRLWFVDGNHEDFPFLYSLAGTMTPDRPVHVRPTITWLPRGHRWTWHGRTWLALGGAVSVDRVRYEEGVDWFPDEEITEAQARRVIEEGPVEVMLCHDAPASVPLRLREPAYWWDVNDLERAARHRIRLQNIVDTLRPTHLLHGHYHLDHYTVVEMAHGPVTVTGLHKNHFALNYRVLDVRRMGYPKPAVDGASR